MDVYLKEKSLKTPMPTCLVPWISKLNLIIGEPCITKTLIFGPAILPGKMLFRPRNSINTNTCNDFKWSTQCGNSVNNGLPILSCYNWPSSSKFMGNWHGKIVNIGILKTFDMPFQWASVPIQEWIFLPKYQLALIDSCSLAMLDIEVTITERRNSTIWSYECSQIDLNVLGFQVSRNQLGVILECPYTLSYSWRFLTIGGNRRKMAWHVAGCYIFSRELCMMFNIKWLAAAGSTSICAAPRTSIRLTQLRKKMQGT